MRAAMSRRWLLLLLLVLVAGCAPHQQVTIHSTEDASYCDNHRIDDDTDGAGAPAAAYVVRVLCGRSIEKPHYWMLYEALDDHAPDPIHVAAMVEGCFAQEVCVDPAHRQDLTPGDRLADAEMAYYASRVDAAQVSRALRPLQLEQGAKDLFIQRYQVSRATLAALLRTFSPRQRTVFLDLPRAIRERRLRDDKALASFKQRFAELKPRVDHAELEHAGDAALLHSLQKLRDDYVRACTARGRTPYYCASAGARPITVAIMKVAFAGKDYALASGELSLFSSTPDRSTVRHEVAFEMSRALDAESSRRNAYDSAKREGIGQAALKEKFGEPPLGADLENLRIADGPHQSVRVPDPPEYRIEKTKTSIRAIRRAGPRAIISFDDKVDRWLTGTGCVETNKVDSIGEDGHVYYREHCSGVARRTKRTHYPSVSVPVDQVKQLKPGNVASVVYDTKTHEGYVLFVYKSAKAAQAERHPIQIGAYRLVQPVSTWQAKYVEGDPFAPLQAR